MLLWINGNIANTNRSEAHFVNFRRSKRTAAQRCTNAGYQFSQSVRFDDVVIGTNFKAHHGVNFRALGRNHNDGNLAFLAQFTTHIGSRKFWKHHVEQHDVGFHAIKH